MRRHNLLISRLHRVCPRRSLMSRRFIVLFMGSVALAVAGDGSRTAEGKTAEIPVIRSVRTGTWSEGATWEGGQVPTAGVKVQVLPGHVVTYDVEAPESLVIRS